MKKQPIYGTRALDFVYDVNPEDFDLADFFGEEAPVRITNNGVHQKMIQHKTDKKTFGKEEQFTTEIALSMKECMLDDSEIQQVCMHVFYLKGLFNDFKQKRFCLCDCNI